MAVDIKVPSVGESISEGVLSRWLKKDGDAVRSGEPRFELETDKATQEVPSPADGVLSMTAKGGSRVAIGSVVGRVDPEGAPRAEGNGPPPAQKAAPAAKAAPKAAEPARAPAPTAAAQPARRE